MAESRDPKELADLWTGWRRLPRPCARATSASSISTNKGARELGFADTGAMWRSNYDMPPDQFSAEVERLWQQVRPFYVSLHAYVRRRLASATATRWCRRTGRFPRTCSATPGRRSGATSTISWRRPARAAARASPSGCGRTRWTRARSCARERASSRLSASPRCRRRSGSVRSSPSRPIATWSATPARGRSTTARTCA